MNQFEYITRDNQRWDQIAYAAYGVNTITVNGVNEPAMKSIIEANPAVPIYDKLPGGIILNIPVLESNSAKTNIELLPPWKR